MTSAAPPPPPAAPAPPGEPSVRVRLEINDEMFELSPADLAQLGLTPAALAAWYQQKTGQPLSDSPLAAKLAAAKLAAAGEAAPAARAAAAAVGGMKRLSDENAAPGGSGGGKRAAAAAGRPASSGGSPVPVLSSETERGFSEALRAATGRRGECSIRELMAGLPGLEERCVFDCLKVFEHRNRIMVAQDTVFLI